jgi:hypothetical protein
MLSALSACGSDDPADPPASGGSTTTGGTGGTTTAGGTGGSTGGSGGGSANNTVPSDLMQATWDAFMTNKSYTMNGWISETATPRDEDPTVPVHGRVRVWFNPTAVTSQKAGNGAVGSTTPHSIDSMVVKELYEADTLVGHAAFLKLDATSGPGGWQYYCKGPADRCFDMSPADTVTFGKGTADCAFCHGGFIFTTAP